MAEVALMSTLSHPNIVQLLGYLSIQGRVAIVSEYVPCGSLYDLLHSHSSINKLRRDFVDVERRLEMALDIARGVEYLHSRSPPVVHRDLKSPNLLVNSNLKLKVRVRHYLSAPLNMRILSWLQFS